MIAQSTAAVIEWARPLPWSEDVCAYLVDWSVDGADLGASTHCGSRDAEHSYVVLRDEFHRLVTVLRLSWSGVDRGVERGHYEELQGDEATAVADAVEKMTKRSPFLRRGGS